MPAPPVSGQATRARRRRATAAPKRRPAAERVGQRSRLGAAASQLHPRRFRNDQLWVEQRELLHEPRGGGRDLLPDVRKLRERPDGRGRSGERELLLARQVRGHGRPVPPVRERVERRGRMDTAGRVRQAHVPQQRQRPERGRRGLRAGVGGIRYRTTATSRRRTPTWRATRPSARRGRTRQAARRACRSPV